jgi:hypothetical protein
MLEQTAPVNRKVSMYQTLILLILQAAEGSPILGAAEGFA